MSINVTFPEELLIAAREEKEAFSRKVIIYTLGHLYQEGKISAGIGAQVLGCDKYTFYTLLSEYGLMLSPKDPIAKKHPDWLLKTPAGKTVVETNVWLDPANLKGGNGSTAPATGLAESSRPARQPRVATRLLDKGREIGSNVCVAAR